MVQIGSERFMAMRASDDFADGAVLAFGSAFDGPFARGVVSG